tara:strand:- start:2227 stop:2469 length:243 start_codon:yes stop_codon:yes gene_type:complete
MKKEFSKKVDLYKESIGWWRDQSMQLAFEAEELDYMYEMGMLSEEEVLVQTQQINEKMNYLMKKGIFEHENLFREFTCEK